MNQQQPREKKRYKFIPNINIKAVYIDCDNRKLEVIGRTFIGIAWSEAQQRMIQVKRASIILPDGEPKEINFDELIMVKKIVIE